MGRLARSLAPFFLFLSVSVSFAGGCAPTASDVVPCFPTESSSFSYDGALGITHDALGWEIDKLGALPDAPENGAPPSPAFLRAQRDMLTEFWPDAGRGFLTVVRGDTHDTRKTRQQAEFDLAVTLYRMHLFGEARAVFKFIAADKKNPRHDDAEDWLDSEVLHRLRRRRG